MDWLPAALRGTVTRLSVGLSGAGIYRLDAGDAQYIVKISDEPVAEWRRKLRVHELAAAAGVAPRIVHIDEDRRAVVTPFVVDRSFTAYCMNPATRDAAVTLLGRTLRRVHDLPLAGERADPRGALAAVWSRVAPIAPAFVTTAVEAVLAETPPPPSDRLVVSHNDVNPSNLMYDGDQLLLVDWNTTAPNDPLYDLATIALFFRMDDATCLRLLAAHDDAPATSIPMRFIYLRRLVAILCGTTFLAISNHTGGGETLDNTLDLGAFYQRRRVGEVDLATAAGRWMFGLALIKSA